jgi:hypothetical protein
MKQIYSKLKKISNTRVINFNFFPLTSSITLEQPKDQKDLQEEKREGRLKEVL